MPRINSRGDVAMGQGGLPGSVNGHLIHDAMGPHFKTDDVIVFPAISTGHITELDLRTGVRFSVYPLGANDLAAGGGVWAAWLSGHGLFSSTDFRSQKAGLIGVGPGGEIAYAPDRNLAGVSVRELDGRDWRLSDGVVYDLQLLGNGRAIWTFGQQVFVRGIPQPQVLPGGVWRPRVVDLMGELWICYYSNFGVVLHPFNDASKGYVIAPPGVDAFQHDCVALGNIIRVVSSARAGEVPSDLRIVGIDPSVQPRVTFGAPQPQPTPIPTPTPTPIPTPTPEPIVRRFTNKEKEILTAIGDKFESLRRGTDDERRAFTLKAAEQLAFSVDPAWGTKRADPGRPPSKDAVAIVYQGQLVAGDIINGTTREMQFGDLEPIPGQVFIQVTPTNHLGAVPEPKPEDPKPDNGDYDKKLAALRAELQADLNKLRDELLDEIARRMGSTDPKVAEAVRAALKKLRIVQDSSVVVSTGRSFSHAHGVLGWKIELE